MKDSTTRADPSSTTDSTIDDSVIRLREWGTERVHSLPPPPVVIWSIGRSSTAALQLRDPDRFVSRRHAELVRDANAWTIRDIGSKNGLWEDDSRRETFMLAPGTEIGIGSVRLIAESERTIAFRALLSRLIGWSASRRVDVDVSLRAVREMAAFRSHLLICGDGDLMSLAHQLHRVTIGDARTFVVSDPQRKRARLTARSWANEPDAALAAHAAVGGTLCVWATRLPHDFETIVRTLREPGTRARLIVCAHSIDEATAIVASPIVLPSLSSRAVELERIVDEYAVDALLHFGAKARSFTAADRDMLIRRQPKSLADIANATLRLVAIRHWGGVTRAAPHLGVSHVALSRWMARMVRNG